MSQQAIDDQNAFIASVGTAFDDGDDALNSLIQALGGNPVGDTVSGAQGVPTTGTLDTSLSGIPVVPSASTPVALLPTIDNPSSWAWAPSPAPPVMLPGGGSGYRAQHGWEANRRRYRNAPKQQPQQTMNVPANCPIIVPLVTTIPIPVSAPAAPATTSAPITPAPATPAAPLSDCRTGNWCIDIRNGCVLSSQVSTQQLQACSAAGYAGNLNMFPAIAAAGGVENGQYFGTPQPNPPPYTPGMSGFGQDDSSAVAAANAGIFSSALESVITGLVAAAALGIFLKGRKKS